MAHIKGNATKGHKEGDRIWDQGTNSLYILKKGRVKDGEDALVWDRQLFERWPGAKQNRLSTTETTSAGDTVLSNWGKQVQNALTIKNGKIFKNNLEFKGDTSKNQLFITSKDTDTAKYLAKSRVDLDASRQKTSDLSLYRTTLDKYNKSDERSNQLVKEFNTKNNTNFTRQQLQNAAKGNKLYERVINDTTYQFPVKLSASLEQRNAFQQRLNKLDAEHPTYRSEVTALQSPNKQIDSNKAALDALGIKPYVPPARSLSPGYVESLLNPKQQQTLKELQGVNNE